MSVPEHKGERIIRGIPVSGGVCRGRVFVHGKARDAISNQGITEGEISGELVRLENALIATRHEISEVQRQVREAMGAEHAGIFDAHLLVLEDPTLIDEVSRLVHNEHFNIAHAFQHVADKYVATLAAIEDNYLRERAADMRDVAARILNNLLGRSNESELRHLRVPSIVISEDLSPSGTALLDKTMVLGFGTEMGSRTSHTAIMARSLKIPAIVGLKDAVHQVQSGEEALLDGFNGYLIINPTDQTLFEYGQLVRKQQSVEEGLRELRDKPAITLEGSRIILSANVEQAADAVAVQEFGAEGVGLFRTEYLFLSKQTLPSEEEQYQAYRQVAATLNPQPVLIRTLDIGGDKFVSHLQIPQEMNPFLGWRAIRFCLERRDIFRHQLRAVLRASADGNVKLMYPMVSGLNELLQANELVEQCKSELSSEGIPFNNSIEIGVMIEIPSAVMIANTLAKHVKFFSIGTNDLIQYSLAVDRLNDKIAHLYEPTHPAIVNLLKMTIDAAHRNGIWVGVCGEMAGDVSMVPLLLGLGADELSTSPSLVPEIKFLIRRMKLSEAKDLADWALTCESGSEIYERCNGIARRLAPTLFETQK
ncbi:MAG: phosphoenolpyruvate--protein phosphotransferase [Verrucomicrobia bacterium]|nr:phosphoenolpyruvate--protein phosphotransferase [Verrucomicrobiota bacterium]